MNSSLPRPDASAAAIARRRFVFPGLALVAAALALAPGAFAQANGDNAGGRADRRAMTPQDFQARMLGQIRERLGVTADDEWALISERITKVMDLRRGAGGGGFGGMMFAGGRGGQGGRGGPGRVNGNPEVAALQGAVADNLPDAEIKSRLERLRDVRKANDAALAKAQDDLRAVVTLRQEAMLVLAGLLP